MLYSEYWPFVVVIALLLTQVVWLLLWSSGQTNNYLSACFAASIMASPLRWISLA